MEKRRGKPNRGGGRANRGGGQRGRGRGGPRGGGNRGDGNRGGSSRGGWSSSRKGGLDLDDSLDGPVLNDPHFNSYEEDHRSNVTKSHTRGRGGVSFPKVKVEMQQLDMTKENQMMVQDTLLSLQSGDRDTGFSFTEKDIDDGDDVDGDDDDGPVYDELDTHVDRHYWFPDRGLVIQDALAFDPSLNHSKAATQENIYAVKRLQRCGFSTELCQEALQICEGDAGAALEYLLNELFSINLTVAEEDVGGGAGETDQQILEAREEEKLALQSIYDCDFEECIPNTVWLLNLKLPELQQLLESSSTRKPEKKLEKKLCPFYLKGFCKFKDRCRLSHSMPVEAEGHNATNLSHPIYANLRAIEGETLPLFSLEIRFPTGNKYPHEPPLVVFSSVIEELRAHTRLNISQFLMSLARDAAQDHLPCVFTLVSALEDKDRLETLLSLPSPAVGKPVSMTESAKMAGLLAAGTTPRESVVGARGHTSGQTKQQEGVNVGGGCLHGSGTGQTKQQEGVNVGGGCLHGSGTGQTKQQEGVSVAGGRLHGSGTRYHHTTERDDGDFQNFVPQKRKDPSIIRSSPFEMRRQNKILQEEFQKKQHLKQYQSMQVDRQRLPAWDMREAIIDTIARNQVVVISGMTGCGKTTQIPQFLLDEALRRPELSVNIICTQPRRISAMAVAQRVAAERAEKLGRSVGYQIRLESVMSAYTRLLYCTTGIILRRLESDPHLEGVTHIIIDEVHERSEESDFLLMILRDVLEQRRDLKVILMSATINAGLFSHYFNNCPVLEIPGKTFPVQQFFLEDVIEFTGYALEDNSPYSRGLKQTNAASHHDGRAAGKGFRLDDLEEAVVTSRGACAPASDKIADMNLSPQQMKLRYCDYSSSTVRVLSVIDVMKINYDLIVHLLEWIVLGDHEFAQSGAILVFLPGYAEIQSLYDMLLSTPEFGIRNKRRYKIIPLHSTLSSEDQNAVFMKAREDVVKIVIATNIAETSITIDDIVYVIDAGRMKEKRYDQAKSMESLDTVWVSQANAIQRKGRAGRVQEGLCFHLFTSHQFNFHLREQPIPEIQRACLEQLVLKIKMLPVFKEQQVEAVLAKLIEPPSTEAINGAVRRLSDLGALDANVELSPLGYYVGSLPVDVRIGKLMLFGAIFRCLDPTLTIAATLSFKTPFVTPFGLKHEADEKRKEFAMGNSDYLTVLNAYRGWCEVKDRGSHQAYVYCQENFLSVKTLQMLASLKQQYVELLSDIGFIQSGIRQRDVERAAKGGSDGVADATGIEANVNSNNWKLVSAMLVAALYPNVVQVLTPDTRYHASSSGAVVRAPNHEELKFKTKQDGYVSIHPSSVNFQVRHYPSPYLVYHEKIKTTKVYIRDCSMVSVYPLLLFAGGSISIDLYHGNFILSVDDGWIQFMAASPQVAELIKELRAELDQLLSDKISQPDMDLLTCPRGSKIINCIVSLISSQ